MGVINFGEERQKRLEARAAADTFTPVDFDVTVTLYEEEYGVKISGPTEDGTAFHELAAAMIKAGAKILLSGTPGVDVTDPVAFGIIFEGGPVCAWNAIGKELTDEQHDWLLDRLEDLCDGVLGGGEERKNDET